MRSNAYLEPWETSMTDLCFCENSFQPLIIFGERLHHRCLAGFSMCLYDTLSKKNIIALPLPVDLSKRLSGSTIFSSGLGNVNLYPSNVLVSTDFTSMAKQKNAQFLTIKK